MPQILKIFPNLILDIAGNGTKKEVRRVEHIIATLGIGRNVEMHGWIGSEQIQELLANSRLLILPSENENFAIVVAEALSAGIPCVVSKNVGLAEIIQKNNAGEVIGELNPNSIAEGILKVLLGDRQKLRSAAFRSAEISLDWSDIANRWKALIASLS
jgi:glycosyltransferase involved in cell wall biosynthesis